MDLQRTLAQRPASSRSWNIWRAIVALFFLGAAAFNLAYTLPKSDEPDLFDEYVEGAWFEFLRDFMTEFFIPNAGVMMVLVVIFEASVGLLISSRGPWVDLGLALSVIWVVGLLPFLAWPYLLVNVVLAFAQGVLLLRRYERPVWKVGGVSSPAGT